jgi:hypothetical protein
MNHSDHIETTPPPTQSRNPAWFTRSDEALLAHESRRRTNPTEGPLVRAGVRCPAWAFLATIPEYVRRLVVSGTDVVVAARARPAMAVAWQRGLATS